MVPVITVQVNILKVNGCYVNRDAIRVHNAVRHKSDINLHVNYARTYVRHRIGDDTAPARFNVIREFKLTRARVYHL